VNPAEELELLARVVLSLLVVLFLAVLAARFLRRSGLHGPGTGLRVLDRTGLSREASVAVVEVGGRALLLGVTAHGVSLLGELDPERLVPPAPIVVDGSGSTEVRAGGLSEPGTGTGGTAVPASPAGRTARAGGRPPAVRGHGSVLSPRTWRQAVEALRDLTARRGS
jgi:flagellar protein FliO/FliZ